MTWTKDRIIQELGHNNNLVERAILAIYQNQTADEKATQKTRYRNGQGFSSADAHLGSYLATYIQNGHRLSGRFLEKGRRLTIKYSEQLYRIHCRRMYV